MSQIKEGDNELFKLKKIFVVDHINDNEKDMSKESEDDQYN